MADGLWRPQWLDLASQPTTHALLRSPSGFLLREGRPLLPRSWLEALDLPILAEQGLGWLGKDALSVIELAQAVSFPDAEWRSLRSLLSDALDRSELRILVYAEQIGAWMRQHRYCGYCGTPTRVLPGERAMLCPTCDLRQYPRLSPSMIVLITRGDEVLLARSAHFPSGWYSALAGFVEPGETLEDCVHREVFEEVGVRVRHLRYLGSQNWPFPHSLMLGFHAEYDGGDIVPQPQEIEDARWFNIDALPSLPGRMSIARYLIDLYVARRKGLPEPVLMDEAVC